MENVVLHKVENYDDGLQLILPSNKDVCYRLFYSY